VAELVENLLLVSGNGSLYPSLAEKISSSICCENLLSTLSLFTKEDCFLVNTFEMFL
jgi:hypothetical protein